MLFSRKRKLAIVLLCVFLILSPFLVLASRKAWYCNSKADNGKLGDSERRINQTDLNPELCFSHAVNGTILASETCSTRLMSAIRSFNSELEIEKKLIHQSEKNGTEPQAPDDSSLTEASV